MQQGGSCLTVRSLGCLGTTVCICGGKVEVRIVVLGEGKRLFGGSDFATRALEVGGLSLGERNEDVVGVDDVVLVKDGVLGGTAIHPDGALCRLYEDTSS